MAIAAEGPGAGFRLTQGLYYLALGTWFGATAMMGVAAGLTFATVRSHRASLDVTPEYLAGNIVNGAFTGLSVIHGVCAATIVVAAALQCTRFRRWLRGGVSRPLNLVRLALLALPVAIFVFDLAYTRPAMADLRQTIYDRGATEAERAAADERFDGYHRLSERLMGGGALLIGGACLLSPFAFHPPGPGRDLTEEGKQA